MLQGDQGTGRGARSDAHASGHAGRPVSAVLAPFDVLAEHLAALEHDLMQGCLAGRAIGQPEGQDGAVAQSSDASANTPALGDDQHDQVQKRGQGHNSDPLRIAVVGQPGVGKSALLDAMFCRSTILGAHAADRGATPPQGHGPTGGAAIAAMGHRQRQPAVGSRGAAFSQTDTTRRGLRGTTKQAARHHLGIEFNEIRLRLAEFSTVRNERGRSAMAGVRQLLVMPERALGTTVGPASGPAWSPACEEQRERGAQPAAGDGASASECLQTSLPPVVICDVPPFDPADPEAAVAMLNCVEEADAVVLIVSALGDEHIPSERVIRFLKAAGVAHLGVFIDGIDALSEPAGDAAGVLRAFTSVVGAEWGRGDDNSGDAPFAAPHHAPGAYGQNKEVPPPPPPPRSVAAMARCAVPVAIGSAGWAEEVLDLTAPDGLAGAAKRHWVSGAVHTNVVPGAVDAAERAAWLSRAQRHPDWDATGVPQLEAMIRTLAARSRLGERVSRGIDGQVTRAGEERRILRSHLDEVEAAGRNALAFTQGRQPARKADLSRLEASRDLIGRTIARSQAWFAHLREAAWRDLQRQLEDRIRDFAARERERIAEAIAQPARGERRYHCETGGLRDELLDVFLRAFRKTRLSVLNHERIVNVKLRELLADVLPDIEIGLDFSPSPTSFTYPQIDQTSQPITVALEGRWWRKWLLRRQSGDGAAAALEKLILAEFTPVAETMVEIARSDWGRDVVSAEHRLTSASSTFLAMVNERRERVAEALARDGFQQMALQELPVCLPGHAQPVQVADLRARCEALDTILDQLAALSGQLDALRRWPPHNDAAMPRGTMGAASAYSGS